MQRPAPPPAPTQTFDERDPDHAPEPDRLLLLEHALEDLRDEVATLRAELASLRSTSA